MANVKKLGQLLNGDDDVRMLVGIIADEETIVGFLLAGIGESCGDGTKNQSFLMVNEGDNQNEVQNFFITLYNRPNIGIILVASDIWKYIIPTFKTLKIRPLPILLQITSKSSVTKPLKLKEK